MIKLIGSILIILGTVLCGLKSILKMRRRVKSLRSVCTSLGIMESEITDRLTPMPELLEILSDEALYPASELYSTVKGKLDHLGNNSFSELWSDALDDAAALMLNAHEKQILCELGMSLGRYNAYEQKKAIEYTLRRLETQAKKAERDSEKDSRVQAVLGLAAGIFTVIIFI